MRSLALEIALQRGMITAAQADANADARDADDLAARGVIDAEQWRTLVDLVREQESLHAAIRDLDGAAAEGPKRVGRYEIQAELGRGGMGIVYRARDTSLGRTVAVKVLRGVADDDLRARFLREAKAAALLRHPAIVPVFDVGEERGQPFFVMEVVEGKPLDKSGLGLRDAVEVLRQAALAVHFAHEKGIVHRDLKPANILVTADRKAMVVDFGLARTQEVEDRRISLSGVAFGTPSYMSPEQARGAWNEVDARSDVYSLGATLYEILTGRSPFAGGPAHEVLYRAICADPVPPRVLHPEAPKDLETVCLKSLAKDRTERYATALDFAKELERWLAGEPVVAEPPSVWRRMGRRLRRNRLWLGMAGAGAAAALAILALALWPGHADVESDPPGAAIWIDGRPTGRVTPARLRLWPPGARIVELRREGYEPARLRVEGRAWKRGAARGVLAREHGTIVFRVRPPSAEYELEGRRGIVSDGDLRVPTGRYRLLLRCEGHVSRTTELVVGTGAVPVEADLPPILVWQHAAAPFTAAVADDHDGDGVPEILLVRHLGCTMLSGAKGSALWTRSFMVARDQEDDARIYAARSLFTDRSGKSSYMIGVHEHPGSLIYLYPPGTAREIHRTLNIAMPLPALKPGDIDGDRVPDWLWIREGNFVLYSGAATKPLWSVRAPGLPVEIRCDAGDLSGDAAPDVVVTTPGPRITVFSGPDGRTVFSREGARLAALGDGLLVYSDDVRGVSGCARLGSASWERAGLATASEVPLPDLDGDGLPDVPVLREDGGAALSGGTGEPLWTGGKLARTDRIVAAHDLDGDRATDLLIGGGRGAAVSGRDGRTLWASTEPGTFAATGDLTGDGVPDLISISGESAALVSGADGLRIWRHKLGAAPAFHGTADLDRDGVPECIFTTTDRLVVVRAGCR